MFRKCFVTKKAFARLTVRGGENVTDFDIEQIYNKYFKNVRAYAYSLCLDSALADDITQETFFKAFKNIDKFRGECKIDVWLCQIAKNTYLSLLRKKKTVPLEDYKDHIASGGIEEAAETSAISKTILKALREIGSPYSDVFYMRVLGGLEYSYIADVFGKSESWARVTFYRAKQKIVEIIKEE